MVLPEKHWITLALSFLMILMVTAGLCNKSLPAREIFGEQFINRQHLY
jgi:hypothetical protein